MNLFIGMAVFFQLFAALAILAIPYISDRDLLFGVPVPQGFRSTETGRRALRTYRLWVAIPATAGILGVSLLPNPWVSTGAILSTTVAGIATFVSLNRELKPFAIQPSMVRQIALGPAEGLPWFTWLGVVPLLFLAGIALYLHYHWDQIPLRYPVHFDITGTPNRWVERTPGNVYGILIFGSEFGLLMFGMAVAGWYGSRRGDPMRKPVVLVLLAAEAMIAFLTGLIPLMTASGLQIPVQVMLFGWVPLLILPLLYAYRESIKPREPLDPTPNECWKGGMIYYNPNDAALFVQRRDGMGFTINFGNRWSWTMLGCLVFVLVSGPLVLKLLE